MSKPTRQKLWHITDATLQVRADGDLPPGIAGRVSGVALTYETVDSYDTMFARKCAKRTIDNRVAARKVPLLMDHERTSKAHVGVVTTMSDVGDALVMTAELFDTADGRAALEYVKAVLASGATTGFSIGFVPRASEMITVDGRTIERFTEIELREVSITPMPAVPGAEVASARHEDTADATSERDDVELLILAARAALEALPADARATVLDPYLPSESTTAVAAPVRACVTDTPTATASTARYVSMEDRIKAVRSTFGVPCM